MKDILQAVELAWAAGFFDGEGCITTTTQPAGTYLQLRISQTDHRPLDRFSQVVGIGNVTGPYDVKEGHQQTFYWSASGLQNTHQVLSLLWPYLSEPKREQTQRVLAKWAASEENIH